jgi:hypothetical protein
MIYSATAKGPYKVAGYHDPDSKKVIGIVYKPSTWAANTVYYARNADDYDIVIPTVFAGMYYKVTNPGKTGATEPVWPTTVGEAVVSGPTFEAVAYNLMLPTESIVTSTFVATDGVTLTIPTFTAGTTQVMISAVPTGVNSFTITNHTVKSNGEEEDVTLYFKVAER